MIRKFTSIRHLLPIVVVAIVLQAPSTLSFSAVAPTVSSLLDTHSNQITSLKKIAGEYPNAPSDDIYYLRYCLSDSDEDISETLKSNLQWRESEGKSIVESAKSAVEQALSSGKWENEPVRDAAPHASIVNEYITPSQCLTTSTRQGDLCYCIRAGQIDDVSLMKELSLEQMTDFFLYCKEVNAIVANMRSSESDRLVTVLTANDLTNVKLIGGDATFRKALSAASKKATELYPELSGPTLLLNLPRLLGALVKLFVPLFPPEVQKRIKFEQGPLSKVKNLNEIAAPGAARDDFLNALDDIVYSG